jgi:hypothetical protein
MIVTPRDLDPVTTITNGDSVFELYDEDLKENVKITRDNLKSDLTSDNLTGSEKQLAKAWVNFNGTGTISIRSSYNVSSLTDNGPGDYTINFTTPMNDTNYVGVGIGGNLGAGGNGAIVPHTLTTGSYRFEVQNTTGINADRDTIMIVIFGL